jgi:hypothetical protein
VDLFPVLMGLKSLVMLVRTINQVYLYMGSFASSMENMPSVLIRWNNLHGEMPSATVLPSFMTVKKLSRYYDNFKIKNKDIIPLSSSLIFLLFSSKRQQQNVT